MISFVRGNLFSKDENSVTIDVGGIGYRVLVPVRTLEKMHTGEEIFLNTYFAVREDAMELYGFAEKEDLKMFEKLITVSGVGPKAAINLLSAFSSGELGTAIVLSDAKKIATAQGIGAKTAARIILELKDKILKETDIKPTKIASKKESTNNSKNEAVLALKVLGYTTTQINEVIDELDIEGLKVEEIIKKALSNMNKR